MSLFEDSICLEKQSACQGEWRGPQQREDTVALTKSVALTLASTVASRTRLQPTSPPGDEGAGFYLLMLCLLIFPVSVYSANLGTMGQVYKIEEQDLKNHIKNNIIPNLSGDGKLKSFQKKISDSYKKSLVSFKGAELPSAKAPKSFRLPLAFVSGKDIHDSNGKLLVKSGTRVVPPKLTSDLELIFISDKPQEVAYAKARIKSFPKSKVVLLNGQPLLFMKREGFRVYFDQHGSLTRRFKIKVTPSVVSRVGDEVEVSEIVV